MGFNVARMLVVGCITFCACACGSYQTAKGNMDKDVEVNAVVIEYLINAMHDDFADGRFAAYDATKLRVISPEPLLDKEITIFHEQRQPADGLWRVPGRRIIFKIDSDALLDDGVIFSGGVSDVRLASR